MRFLVSFFKLCVAASLVLSPLGADGQTPVGRPAPGRVIPVEHGFIDPATGNLHLEIPLEAYKQRGEVSDTLRLVYDSSIWTNEIGSWQPTAVTNSYGGWRVESADTPTNYYYDTSSGTTSCGSNSYYYVINDMGWEDLYGSTRLFPIQTVQVPAGCSAPSPYVDTPSGSAYATDGSGYYATISNYGANYSIWDPAGTLISQGINGHAYQMAIDRNGNYLGSLTNASSSPDTLNRTVITASSGGPNTIYYDLLSYGGGTQRYTITTQEATLNTAFGYGGGEFTGTVTTIARLDLPDGSFYNFSYDGAYGQLIGMTLPQSGNVSFGYATPAPVNAWQPRYLSSHDGSDGHTSFKFTGTPSLFGYNGGDANVGCFGCIAYQMTRTDGTTVMYASKFQRIGYIGYYTAPVTSLNATANRLMADYLIYDWSTSCPGYGSNTAQTDPACQGFMWQNLLEYKRIDDAAGIVKAVQYNYANVGAGIPTDVKMWDYYPHNESPDVGIPDEPSGTPKREVAQQLGLTVNGRPFVTDIKTYGNGSLASWTSYGYDESGHQSGASHAPQLTAVSGSRGNQTSVTRHCLEDGHLATTNLYYDDAGILTKQVDPLLNATTFAHDSTDVFVTKVTYPNSFVADFTQADYDISTGVVNHVWDENSAKTTYGYDILGRLTSITRPDGGNSSITYTSPQETDIARSASGQTFPYSVYKDGYGRTIRKTTGVGNDLISSEIGYTGTGAVYSISTPHGINSTPTDGTSFYTYDIFGRILNVQKADGNVVSATYSGNTLLIQDENSNKKQLAYDAFGDLISVVEQNDSGALGWATGYVYDNLGLLAQIYQTGATNDTSQWRTSSFGHDSFGRVVSQSMPEYGVKTLVYDDNDNLTSITDSANRSVGFKYDSLNRVIAKQLSNGPTYVYGYDGNDSSGDQFGIGRLTDYSSNTGTGALLQHDIEGRLTKESFCLPSDCSYTVSIGAGYDQADNLTALTYPDGRTIRYHFDSLNRLYSVTSLWNQQPETNSPLVSSSQYAPVGLLSHSALGNGIQLSASFGPRLNLSSLSYANSQGLLYSKNLTWDATGGNLIASVDNVDASKSTNFSYDQVNRLTSVAAIGPASSNASATVTLTISGTEGASLNGARLDCSQPDQCTDPNTVWDSGTVTVSVGQQSYSASYGQGSNFSSVASDLANAIACGTGSPLTATSSGGTITLGLKAYGTYALGIQWSSSDFRGSLSGALIGSSFSTPSNYSLSESYTYDAWGNLNQSGNFTFQQSYTANNQMVSGYQYDSATGNITGESIAGTGVSNSFSYDAEGRLIGSNGAAYVRDPFGRRVSRSYTSTTEYLYLGDQLIATRDPAAGVWTDRVSANGRNIAKIPGPQNTPPVYRLGDQLDSTALLSDANGNITGGAEFTPYGQVVSSSGTDSTMFTGDEQDTENLTYHTLYRNLSPIQGRWLSPDPYMGSIDLTDPQSFNRYAYLANRPLSGVDTLGLDGGDGDDGDDDGDDDGGQNVSFPSDPQPATFLNGTDTQTDVFTFSDGSMYNVTSNLIFIGVSAPSANASTQGGSVAEGIMVAVGTGLSFVPGPVGGIAGAGLAVHAASKGNYGQAAMLAGGAALQFFGLPGEEVAQVLIHGAEVAPEAVAAAEAVSSAEETVTLYRGVSNIHPGYENALKGIAEPWGGTATAAEHAGGNTASEFTSWTSDVDVAAKFAKQGPGMEGVILQKEFSTGSLIPTNAFPLEKEFLVRGSVSGAHTFPVNMFWPDISHIL